jgi:hypothetical protein
MKTLIFRMEGGVTSAERLLIFARLGTMLGFVSGDLLAQSCWPGRSAG